MKQFDKPFIEELISAARRKNLTGVKIKVDELFLEIELGINPLSTTVQHKEKAEPANDSWVTSTMVGYFRQPEKAVTPGMAVQADTVIGVLEALGLPNEIYAGKSGILESLVVKDGEVVEFGQRIARLKT